MLTPWDRSPSEVDPAAHRTVDEPGPRIARDWSCLEVGLVALRTVDELGRRPQGAAGGVSPPAALVVSCG